MTDKITELTPEQEKEIIRQRDECIQKGRTTGPCDRKEVEEIFTKFYAILDERPGMA